MSKPTPGPWEINEQYIIARSKRGLRTICQWRSYSDEANAHLIEAAPDLLAALYSAEEQLELTGIESDALKLVRAAIAKAEGKIKLR